MLHIHSNNPTWYKELIHTYFRKWDGSVDSTDELSAFLKKYAQQPDFKKYLSQFKAIVNQKTNLHRFKRTETKNLFVAQYSHDNAEYKRLNSAINLYIKPLNDFYALLFLLGQFAKNNPIAFMFLLANLVLITRAYASPIQPNQCKTDSSNSCVEPVPTTSLIQSENKIESLNLDVGLFKNPIDSELIQIKKEVLDIEILFRDDNGLSHSVSDTNKKRIQMALFAVSNLKAIQIMAQNKVVIYIVSEQYMNAVTRSDDFSAVFISRPENCILLNEHLFKDWNQLSKNQLTTLLANELSHVSIHNMFVWDEVKGRMDPVAFIVPWQNENQKINFLDALKDYKENIKEYRRLDKKRTSGKELTESEQKKIAEFDHAIMSYIPQQYGSDHSTAIQNIWSMKGEKLHIEEDFSRTEPPPSEPKDRKRYLIDAFFQEQTNKALQNKLLYKNNIGIYKNKYAESMVIADELSDFESNSPNMRETFGDQLCSYLDGYFDNKNHCYRKAWPR